MIDLNDLSHSINRALSLGRYTITVGVHGGEQVPASIELDLIERDDDDFYLCLTGRDERPTVTPEGDVLVDTVTDDHGPAIPAQDHHYQSPDFIIEGRPEGVLAVPSGPRIYEFALQDLVGVALGASMARLEDVSLIHARMLDSDAVNAADYVHVYDRVTRERRTLKRPEPDAVLTGLRDVAADLRGERGKEVFTPADPMPPIGPLTSTEGLRAGDIVRCVTEWAAGEVEGFGEKGAVYSVSSLSGRSGFSLVGLTPGSVSVNRFAFVARPGVWMPWEGGENPVPGMSVRVRLRQTGESEHPSKSARWSWGWPTENGAHPGEIIAYMVVDPSPVSSDT